MKQLKVSTKDNGKLRIEGLEIWSTGTFHGYGSPPEGDTFTGNDLQEMERAHQAIGNRVRPRMYPGHPVNPMLKLLARPQGEITEVVQDGDRLVANLDDVDPTFWAKAQEDKARFSPDIQYNRVDPTTGEVYPKVIVGLGVLGGHVPANEQLPALDEYMTRYYAAQLRSFGGQGEIRSYLPVQQEDTSNTRSYGASGGTTMSNNDIEAKVNDIKTTVERAAQRENEELGKVRSYASGLESQIRQQAAKQAETDQIISELRENNRRLHAILEAQLTTQGEDELKSYASSLRQQKKITPAEEPKLVNLLKAVAGVAQPVHSFALGEVEGGDGNLLDLFKDFLESRKPLVETVEPTGSRSFGAAKSNPLGGKTEVRSFATNNQASADVRESVNERMREAKEKGVSLTYQQALRQVIQESAGQ